MRRTLYSRKPFLAPLALLTVVTLLAPAPALATLPVAFAAAGHAPRVERIDAGVDAGVLAMDSYLFWPSQLAR